MPIVTLADARLDIADVVGRGALPTDPLVVARINDATRRLGNLGTWVGSVAEATICTSQQCFTLPKELSNAMEFYIADPRVDVPSGWYHIDNPSTYIDPDFLNDIVLVDLGEFPSAFDVCGPKLLKVYSDTQEDATLQLRLFGYDENTKEIYTIQNGVYAKGELVAFNQAGVVTVNSYMQLNAVQKPVTLGPIRLYSVDPNTAAETLLAIYAPEETSPSYRRYFCADIPLNTDGSPVRVRVTGQRQYAPVSQDTDALIIPNVSALKLEVLSIERQLASDFQQADYFHKQALELLTKEADNYQLDPVRATNRKAQYLIDEQTYVPWQLGHVRAKLALELPNLLRIGLRPITRLINNAEERLIMKSAWYASVGEINFKIQETGYLVLPNFVDSVLSARIDRHPLHIRNQWFETIENGPGYTSKDSFGKTSLIDRGTGPTWFDLTESSSVSVYSSATETNTPLITITGLDDNGLLATESVGINGTSNTVFSKITQVSKPATVGFITLESVDHPILSIMQPNDTLSFFRRYFVPGLGENYDPETVISCRVKLKHAHLFLPSDTMTLRCYGAIKTMVQAIALEDAGDLEKSGPLEQKAVQILQDQLKSTRGGAQSALTVQVKGWGPGRIRQPR